MIEDQSAPPRIVFAAATAATIVGQLGIVFAPFLVLLAMKQTGLDDAAVSWIISAEFLAYLVAALIASSVRAFNHARVATVASLCFVLGSVIAAGFSDPVLFGIGRMLCGVGGGALMVSGNRMIASHHCYARLFAFAIIGTALFAIVGLLVVPAIIQHSGSAAAYLALGTLGVAAALLSPFMVAGSRVPQRMGMNFAATSWVILAAYFLSRLCDALLWPYIERFGERVGLNTGAVGIVLSAATVVAIAGPLIALRVQRPGAVLALFALALLSKAAAPLAMAALPSVPIYVSSQFLVSFGLVLAGQLFLSHLSAVDASGRLAGLAPTVGLLADAGGVVLAGWAFAAGGFWGVAVASGGAGLAAVALCLPALAAWHVHEPRKREVGR